MQIELVQIELVQRASLSPPSFTASLSAYRSNAGMSIGYKYVCTRSMHVLGRGRYGARSSNFTQHLKSTRVRIHFVTHFGYGGHVKRGL